MLEGFHVSSESEINLMVLHGDVGNPASVYNPISEAMIESSGLDYLALGHVHAYGGIKNAGKTTYAYSGCLEPRGFDETGSKGYIEGYLSCGNCSLAFVEASERKYVTVKVDIGGCESVFDIIRRIEQEKTDPEGIYLFILTGGLTDLDIVDEKLLYEHFAGKYFDFKFKNETRLQIDLEKIANERSLKGIFVKNMEKARREAKDKTEEEKAGLALRYGLDALLGNELL
ncbi:hypothetical protein SDC9_130576 [bioreactor metagenome]|uniref:Calcineurin-like phosphoesterase domain-containing protein n=1 Tax=bioreactor metagenome TaxID=1076179 RepID=A0A645D4E0_9ZZZZ